LQDSEREVGKVARQGSIEFIFLKQGGIMLRHLISVLTVVSLLVTSFLSEVASAATKAEKEAKQVEKIKQKVRKVGTDEYALITATVTSLGMAAV
jgi:hypothetical protein